MNAEAPVAAADPWRQSLVAARANLVPGLLLQAFALVLVLAYYFHPAAHRALDLLAGVKARYGWWYSIFSTSVSGGVIPYVYLRLHPRTHALTPASHGLFYALFWAYKGFEVDLFYRMQAHWFGSDPTVKTIAEKILVDQLVYNPFWSAPLALLVFHWKEHGFRFGSMRSLDIPRFLALRLPSALIATWAVWLPAVAIIYSLPSTLQVPLFNIVLCFFSLMYVTLTRR